MTNPNSSIYLPEEGVRPADATAIGVMRIPNEDVAGRNFVRRPTGTPWNAFSALPRLNQAGNTLGWLRLTEDDNGTSYRIPMFDHPGND